MESWNKTADKEAIERTIKSLKENGINALFCETGAEAIEKILNLIPERAEVFTFDKIRAADDVLVDTGLAASKSEARRLIEQGGVSVDGSIVKKPNQEISQGIIKVGKYKFAKIKPAP